MENFRSVKWNRSALAFGILGDHMAAAFGAPSKNPVFPVWSRFRARSGVGAWALDSNFNSREAHGNLGNLLTVGESVSYV